MKFLCDQCKAKYQISDDKVAGKTVRMKCRKCGHLIEVRAAVTETSVASSLLQSEPPPAAGAGTPGAAAAGAGAGAAGPSGAPPRPPAAKPSVLPKSPLATSLAHSKPPVPRPGTKGDSGLSTAFKSSMQTAKEDEAALLELSTADEWYAAINGVPVGPVRIGELRRKAALGAVTDDSLVWQEGMEEWRPVKTIPELAMLVREAATTNRVSLLSPEPPNVTSGSRASGLPPAPSVRPPRPTPPRPVNEPARPAATAARSNVVPITGRLATAERLEEAPAPATNPTSERFSLAPDPFAAAGKSGPAPSPGAATSPPATAASAIQPPTQAAAAQAQAPVIVQMPKQTNYVGIGLVLAMVTFAGVTSWALFFKKAEPPPPPTVNTIYVHDPAAAPSVSVPDTTTTPADSASAGPKKSGAIAAAPKASASSAPDLGKLLGQPGSGANPLDGLRPDGLAGPKVVGTSLSGSQMETVMKMHQQAVKKVCWTGIGGGGASSAAVTVHVTIDGNGHVSKAVAEGNNGPVGTCLEREIRGWQFPASGAPTGPVDFPYKFVNQ